jgi:hypothetical protein
MYMDNKKIITYDGLIVMIENQNLFINEKKMVNFINSNDKIKKYHTHLHKHFKKVLSDKTLPPDCQTGGDMTTIFLGLGTTSLFLVAGYFIYKWIKANRCKPEYPILEENQYPTTIQFLQKIVPSSWLGKTDNSEVAITNLMSKVNSMSASLSMLDTDSSMLKSIGVNLLRVTSSVALDVATLGAGGDIIISLLFTFKSVLDLIASIITHLNDVIQDPDSMRLLYDILNVNFLEGPRGVECWIRYIINEYGDDTSAYDTVCDFFHKIFDKLANFIGNAMGAMIPDSAGMPGLLIPMLIKQFKSGAVSLLESQVKKYYKKIPHDIQVMITKPKLLKKFLDKKIKFGSKILLGFGNNLRDSIVSNTWGFAYSIHKFFALMFSLFYVLKVCFKKKHPK